MKVLPSTTKSLAGSLFAVALVAWSPLQTRADTIAFSVSSTASIAFGDNTTLGYAFTVSSPVTVTNLGLFDFGNDGLNTSHAVTIWTSTGTQLVQTTIPAGTAGTLIDGFRYVDIEPFILAPGTYTIGAYSQTHHYVRPDFFLTDATFTSAYEVSYLGPRLALEGGFRFPSGTAGLNNPDGYFGPNFWFTCGDPTQPPALCHPPWRARAHTR
jgi:hypothetical protein